MEAEVSALDQQLADEGTAREEEREAGEARVNPEP
jgi:hypothetical protein